MKREPVKVGDQVPFMCSMRMVMAVTPYTGKYRHWFNVVLRLSSPQTRSGYIETAYDDRALRDSK